MILGDGLVIRDLVQAPLRGRFVATDVETGLSLSLSLSLSYLLCGRSKVSSGEAKAAPWRASTECTDGSCNS